MLALLLACSGSTPAPAPEPEAPAVNPAVQARMTKAKSLFGALPPADPSSSTQAQRDLGRMLYYDGRLSLAGDVSCNSCHALDAYGVDGAPTSTGHEGQLGGRNAPTVYNAFLHTAQFWDGREPDVEAQAKGPPLNPIEMAMPDAAAVEARFQAIEGYAPLFAAAFPDQEQPVTFDNMAIAIGAFERQLVTPGPLDAFIEGDASALSSDQQAGLDTFVELGCTACHSGPLLGGKAYFKLGLVEPYEDDDMGRFDVTGQESDKQVFKVPSLRNIEKTGPYFHHGEVATLDEAVRLMGKHQLGRELSDQQVASVTTFLGALTGPLDTAYIAQPELPQ